ncbi:uncharacterized protein LOC127846058 [Dreissena polymorpha]|uniref:uncharacterized protein LOC127846058 n=1 Tax=Dreissena polymorpha TaxID=45954 RepID=UPI0022655FBE|nr:uncharacterized protein LOC127846058 [Dreissena polymorpha]
MLVNGRIDSDNYGKETLFSSEEELGLVEHAENSARLGYGYSNTSMQRFAGELAYKLGKRPSDEPLSNCWLYSFLKRWYDRPRSPPPNSIALTKEKAHAVTSPRSATTTLIAFANAAGACIPPYFVFKGKRYNEELLEGATPGARATMSDSGWSTTYVFKDYLENHFLKYAARTDENQPILLLLDGHTTHTTPELTRWARSKNLHLFCLPAHSYHLLQPLDVAVFGPFKRYYYSECASFMKENIGKAVTMYDMARIACKASLKAMSPWNIVLVSMKLALNKHAISDVQLMPCEAFRDETPVLKCRAIQSRKHAVDAYLERKLTVNAICSCLYNCQKKKPPPSIKKHDPSGKEITSDEFLEDMEMYASQKENLPPSSDMARKSESRHPWPLT